MWEEEPWAIFLDTENLHDRTFDVLILFFKHCLAQTAGLAAAQPASALPCTAQLSCLAGQAGLPQDKTPLLRCLCSGVFPEVSFIRCPLLRGLSSGFLCSGAFPQVSLLRGFSSGVFAQVPFLLIMIL